MATRGPAANPGFQLWHATMLWKQAITEGLAPLEITHTQFFLLGSLLWLERPNQRELADHTGLDRMTTSQVVRTLEKRGYVTRQEDPEDLRAYRLSLTRRGRETAKKAAEIVRTTTSRFFSPLGDELPGFVEALRRVSGTAGASKEILGDDAGHVARFVYLVSMHILALFVSTLNIETCTGGTMRRGWLMIAALATGCGTSTTTAEETPEGVTYQGHIRGLYEQRCVSCHVEGNVGPFPLDTYEAARAAALPAMIATRERRMPPWGAETSGECGQAFEHSRELTDEEIDMIAEWVEAGTPEGDPADHRAQTVEPLALTGALASLDMTAPYTPEPDAIGDDYRCFLLDGAVPRDGFVTGFQVTPGNREIVHHILLFNMAPRSVPQLEALDAETEPAGWPCPGLAGEGVMVNGLTAIWTPGVPVVKYPEGTGVKLSAGERFILQVHYYAPSSKGSDQTRIDLEFADDVARPGAILLLDGLIDTAFSDEPMMIPPGEKNFEFTWDTRDEEDDGQRGPTGGIDMSAPYQVHGVFPHMHQLGRTFRAVQTGPGIDPSCAMHLPRYDFDWQQMYFYADPIPVEPGQGFEVTCGFDSSGKGAPTAPGFGAEEEMCSMIMYASQ